MSHQALPPTLYVSDRHVPSANSDTVLRKGLRDIGQVKPGETLVVSGAAGSVGSIACQLGKRAGAKVYAIAGSADKCDWLEREVGVDKAFNYKSPTFREDFKKIGYLDVFFDNVGGMVSYALHMFYNSFS